MMGLRCTGHLKFPPFNTDVKVGPEEEVSC
jgi:hypothetical protein